MNWKNLFISLLALLFAVPSISEAQISQSRSEDYKRTLDEKNLVLRQILDEKDYGELMKGEELWAGNMSSLCDELDKIISSPYDLGVFSRVYIEKENKGLFFLEDIRYSKSIILYADENWIVTRDEGRAEKSSLYTFWSTLTGKVCMKIHLPGSLYLPIKTSTPAVYVLKQVPSKNNLEDFRTWHGKNCLMCFINPLQKSFISVYEDEKRDNDEEIKKYDGLIKSITEEPYYKKFGRLLKEIYNTSRIGNKDIVVLRKSVELSYNNLNTKMQEAAALRYFGKTVYLMPPVELEEKPSYRIPKSDKIHILGDYYGKTSSLSMSSDNIKYTTIDFDALEKTVKYFHDGITKKVVYCPDGFLSQESEDEMEKLKKKISPLPVYMKFNDRVGETLNNVCFSNVSKKHNLTLFVCNSGYFTWEAGPSDNTSELLGISLGDKVYYFNPFRNKVNEIDNFVERGDVQNLGTGVIENGDNMIQFSGDYKLLNILESNENYIEMIVCKQVDINKIINLHIGVDLFSLKYKVLSRDETNVYKLPPLCIAKKRWFLRPNSDYSYEIMTLDRSGKTKIATLFVVPDLGAYAIVLPNEHYVSSPGFDSMLCFFDNNRMVPLSLFATWKNKPGEVLEALNGNKDDVLALKKMTNRWLRKQKITLENEPCYSDISTVKAKFPELHQKSSSVDCEIELYSGKSYVDKLEVLNNGNVIDSISGIGLSPYSKKSYTISIKLIPGINNIEICSIENTGMRGIPMQFRLVGKKDKKKEKMYVVTLGVSKYQNEALNLKFAAKDAYDVANLFKQLELKQEVCTLTLVDEEVYDREVLNKIEEFLKDAKPCDKVILYFAGHGMLDNDFEYFYAPAGFDETKIELTGISMDDIYSLLKTINVRDKLLLLDTCHAGFLGEKGIDKLSNLETENLHAPEAGNRGMVVKKVKTNNQNSIGYASKNRYIDDFFQNPLNIRGINVIAASAGNEFSQESEKWGNGAFTSSIIKAMSRKEPVDANADGALSVDELSSFVVADVLEITNGQQKPSIIGIENARVFNISYDLASFVNEKDWSGCVEASRRNIKVNEGIYPKTEAIVNRALEYGAPEEALLALLENGANINRVQTKFVRKEVKQSVKTLTDGLRSYTDFDGKMVDFCEKNNYSAFRLRKLFAQYYHQHSELFGAREQTKKVIPKKREKKIRDEFYR